MTLHQIIRRRSPGGEALLDAVENPGHRPAETFYEGGRQEPVRPATDGLIAIAEAAIRSGLQLIELKLGDPSWGPSRGDLSVAEELLTGALREQDRGAVQRELRGTPHRSFVRSLELRDPRRGIRVFINRDGGLDLRPPKSPDLQGALSTFLRLVEQLDKGPDT